ncbi:MAG: aspartate aminotransferase family protein, partial [Spirochaetia bacterium]|nr:aspartate aminotransferase family protein [Spirochaetia bacterium]
EKIKAGISGIPGLEVMGDPLFVVAFRSTEFDIYRLMDFLTHRKWNLNGLHRPACIHLCVTLRHTQPGVALRFIKDLREGVAHVRATPAEKGGSAPVYGMAATIPVRSLVGDLLKKYMDMNYRV